MRRGFGKILDHLPYVGNVREANRELHRHVTEMQEHIDQLQAQLSHNTHAIGAYSAGHYYSPIPNQDEIKRRINSSQLQSLSGSSDVDALSIHLPDLDLNRHRQLELLEIYSSYYRELPFTEEKQPGNRYYYDQSYFCYADAIFLCCFLRFMQPKRIIEVGSGFSSAVLLDSADHFLNHAPDVTFIEPYPDRLKSILRPEDYENITIREEKVQAVPLDVFAALQAGDLLFIDSSHVVKFGNDLHFLFFEVLPLLAPGVSVHFHDVFYPFEYPEEWLRDGRYWNEDYFLRAFLAYNNEWDIQFFNTYVASVFKEVLQKDMPLCLKNTGGSIYIQKNLKD
jgi:predicted O-methyltransferase YrrM